MQDPLHLGIPESAGLPDQRKRYLRHLPRGSEQRGRRIDYEVVSRRNEFRTFRHGDGVNFRQDDCFRTPDPKIPARLDCVRFVHVFPEIR